MVTVETAIVLVGLVVVVTFAGFALTVGVAQVRCVDAARDAARAAARGEPSAAEIGRRSAPAGASISIDHVGSQVVVRVEATVHPPGVLAALAGVPVRAHATVDAEPGVGDGDAGSPGMAEGPP